MANSIELDKKRLNNPAFGVQCALRGLFMLGKPGIRRYVAVPLLLNIVLYSLVLWISVFYISELVDRFIPGWLEWLSWLIWPVFLVSFLLAAFFTFTLVANVLMAPFYGRLAERTERLLMGEGPEGPGEVSLVREITRAMLAELHRLGYFAMRAVPLLLLFVIPGINLIAPFLWMLFSAWVLGLEYTAYPLENRGILFPEQRGLVKDIRFGLLSFGGLVMVGLTVPVLNVIVPPAAVVGGTAYVVGRKQSVG